MTDNFATADLSKKTAKKGKREENPTCTKMHKKTESQNKIAHYGKIESILPKNRNIRFLSNTCRISPGIERYACTSHHRPVKIFFDIPYYSYCTQRLSTELKTRSDNLVTCLEFHTFRRMIETKGWRTAVVDS
jgi:hypothetical protein